MALRKAWKGEFCAWVLVALVALAVGGAPAWATDEPDTLSPGTVVVIKPGLLKFTLKGIVYPPPSAANDPTVEGATMEVFDSAGQLDVFGLPAARWSAISGGFKFVGDDGECGKVILKGTVIKAVCKGAIVTITAPLADPLGVVLKIGTTSNRYCASFGGNVVRNQPGLFKAKGAPAPSVCPEPPQVCGDHKCTFNGSLALNLVFGPLGPFPLVGALDLLCPGVVDGDGKCACDSEFQAVNPVVIPVIGTVCVLPAPAGTCSSGDIDCDGGNGHDIDLEQDHNIGTCTSNAGCATQCTNTCTALGKVVVDSSCEGFCMLSGAACTNDSDCPPGDACSGDEPVGHANVCRCTCLKVSGAGGAGDGHVFVGFALNVNVGVGDNGPDGIPCTADDTPSITLPPACAAFTTTTTTGTLFNANNNVPFPGTIGPIVGTGAPFVCTNLITSNTTGTTLEASLSFYDTALGDLEAALSATCQ